MATFVSLLLGFLSFIFIFLKSYQGITEFTMHYTQAQCAQHNLILIEETLSLLRDIETGQRGFVITGNDSFLEPFKQARERLDASYSGMKQSMQQEGQPFPSKKLDALMQTRVQQAEQMIEQRRRMGARIIEDHVLFSEVKASMDAIRAELNRLKEVQNAILASQTKDIEDMADEVLLKNKWLFAWGSLVLLLAAACLVFEKQKRDQAERSLQDLNASLERVISERTRELDTALQRITSFASELNQNIEAERRRVAREVHDQLGQLFTVLSLTLTLDSSRRSASLYMNETWLAQIRCLVDDGLAVTRRISHELSPPLLDDFGLDAAVCHYLEHLIDGSSMRYAINIEDDKTLTPVQANQLFRITQESVTNILRHSHAKQIYIEGRRDGDGYYFAVTDDGRGIGLIRSDASGIRNMRERTALMGGKFSIAPAEGGGTVVAVVIPDKKSD